MSKDARENLVIISVQLWQWMWNSLWLRACLHGGGGPQVGEVTRLSGVRNIRPLHAIYPAIPGCTFSRLLNGRWVRALGINARLHSLVALAATFSAVALIMMQSHRQSEFCAKLNPTPASGVTPPWTFTWQNLTPAERVTRSGRPGYPPWWVTPPIM